MLSTVPNNENSELKNRYIFTENETKCNFYRNRNFPQNIIHFTFSKGGKH